FLEEVREIADNFTVLRDGHSVATGKIDSFSDDELIMHMVGRRVDNLFPRRPATSPFGKETVLEVRDLAAPPALKGASFELRRGEIFGIAGLMGSGRTNVVRSIFGLDRHSSGSISVKDQTRGVTPAERLSQSVGYLSEDRKNEGLAITLSIADNVTMTRFKSCSRFGWLNLSRQRAVARDIVSSLAVKARDVEQPVTALSGGNQQKIALARLLHQQAEVLLLDEPTRGIDIGSKAQVYKTIAQCAGEGKAVLMISSYLPELFGMCDRLAVMSRGRLSPARPINEWTPESVMQAAIAGEGN
ncbi:MAG TPA: ATP-binding cassette domain-containing protein, partial [Pyrinomonadaceae bacterium]|nr:ATP-binding cassette domain-containing protein [Pyrinomonadaceae bacterium]